MLVLMTIYTEILPVGTIWRVVPMVPILMMDRQELPVSVFKLSSTFGTDEPVYF